MNLFARNAKEKNGFYTKTKTVMKLDDLANVENSESLVNGLKVP
ncbi:hypothetical protein SAMN05518683_10327 [Salibacterium halotolerans]|uniref:Uncharacterized protein n=1 Tax=Salibacterium halotolerans TaxID=1884432 RepID=A0A1I5N7R3_9BACI|nr:hypothetical protein SAMN05518683_10327 [Salibacterium halotolerans]